MFHPLLIEWLDTLTDQVTVRRFGEGEAIFGGRAFLAEIACKNGGEAAFSYKGGGSPRTFLLRRLDQA